MSDSKTFIRPLRDKTVRNMALLCAVGFGGFCSWGAIAPLEEGVAASGQIVVEDNRQMVQHLEGGIVSELRVKEGEIVEAGDVLVVLQRTASLSSRDQIIQRSTRQVQSSREGQILIAEKALKSARAELDVISSMFQQQLARRDQVTSAERLVATLEGDIAALTGQRDDARASEADLVAQIAQTRALTARETATSLLETGFRGSLEYELFHNWWRCRIW